MTSSYTTRNRVLKQGTGDNTNTWGDLQSTGDFDLLDAALDGLSTIAVTGNVTLTSVNGMADQARMRVLKLTGTVAATITIPALEKWYAIHNATSQSQIISSAGGGTTATLVAGEVVFVYCDATNVTRATLKQMANALDMGSNKITSLTDPTSNQDAATKKYVDDATFGSTIPNFPALAGNALKGLHVNAGETNVEWVDDAARLNATVLTQDASPDVAADWLVMWDTSAGAPKKALPQDAHLPYRQIATNTVSVAASTITFTAIPQTYASLLLVFTGFTSSADFLPQVQVSVDNTNYSTAFSLTGSSLTASGNVLKGAVRFDGYAKDVSQLLPALINDANASPLVVASPASVNRISVVLATGGIHALKFVNSAGNWTAGTLTLYGA